MFKHLKNFICSPTGMLTIGMLYGASLVGIYWADDKREGRRVTNAYEKGIYAGMDLHRRGFTESDITFYRSKDLYARMMIIPKKGKKCPNSTDNGAKTGDSCTISPVTAPTDTTMVQTDNLSKED